MAGKWIVEKFNKIFNFLLDLIFPKICLSCSQEGDFLCQNCLESIPLVEKFTCPVCGRLSLYGKTCENCRRKTALAGLINATSYKNPVVERAIKLLKYEYIKSLSQNLSVLLIKVIKNSYFLTNNFSEPLSSFLIIPVPLHRQKFLDRGFNQAELIAQKIAEEFDLKLRNDLLIKIKNTRSQTDLKETERKINIQGAFAVKNKKEIKGKIIFLVDDVFTTGSTLNEAARVLKVAGAKEIWGIALARG